MQKGIRHFGFSKRLALVEISAVLLAISMPGMISNLFIWIGLVPFFFAVENSKRWQGFLYGWFLGVTFLGIALYWLLPTLTMNISAFDGFPSYLGGMAFFVSLLIEGLFWSIFGLSYLMISKSKAPWFVKALSVSSAYTLIEYLRGIGDIGFTGARLSNALYSQIGIIQLSSFFGTLGLVFVIVLVNYLFYVSLKRKKTVIMVGVLLSIVFLYSTSLFVPRTNHDKILKIGVVQPNVSVMQRYKMSESEISKDVNDSIEKLGEKVKLIIFPEGTFEYDLSPVTLSSLKSTLRKYKAFAMIGFPSFSHTKVYNAVGLFDFNGLKNVYYKHILVPFTEKLPYPQIFGVFKFLKLTRFFTPGTKYTLFTWNGVRFAAQICFESYFGRLSRKFTNEGAEFLVTVTNDSWFSEKTALEQHFAQSVFRAVENRRWTIQVADTGITGVIDEYGRVVEKLPIHRKEAAIFTIEANNVKTLYDVFGNWINWLAVLFLAFNVTYDTVKRIRSD